MPRIENKPVVLKCNECDFEWYDRSVLPWAQNEYVGVKYKDAHLNLLKGSKDVRWDDLDAAVAAGEASLTAPR